MAQIPKISDAQTIIIRCNGLVIRRISTVQGPIFVDESCTNKSAQVSVDLGVSSTMKQCKQAVIGHLIFELIQTLWP